MASEDDRKLFVAGLPDSITEDVLRQLFEATGGSVVSVSLPKDRVTGRPRGFGFVTLGSAEETAQARDALDGSMQAGHSISVRPFQSEPPRRGEGAPAAPRLGPGGGGAPMGGRDDRGQDRTLYVGNLPYDTSQAEIEQLFTDRGAGSIARLHLPVGPDGRMRGFGFVTLPSAEAANAAIVALREADLRGRRLMINIAHPRGERPPGAGGGGDFRGADRAPRPWDGPPRESRGFGGPPPELPPMEGARGDRRRVLGPDKTAARDDPASKKKKKTGGEGAAKPKRGRADSWKDWDDE